MEVPDIKLNNGLQMPVFGLSTGHQTMVNLVKHAIDVGYKLFECTQVQESEIAIGAALQEKIHGGAIKRKDLFIISRYWYNKEADSLESTLLATLNNLQTSYVDLYLLYLPVTAHNNGDEPHLYEKADITVVWKALEEVYKKNLVKAIGVSNFNSKQIDTVLKTCSVFPQVNQIECHPYFNQRDLRKYCADNGIVVVSSNSLGELKSNSSDRFLLNNSNIKKIADRYNKTPAQILLRYNLQLNNVVVPQIFTKKELMENLDIFDFYIAPEDMSYMNSCSCNK